MKVIIYHQPVSGDDVFPSASFSRSPSQRPASEGTFREAQDLAAGWTNLREQGARAVVGGCCKVFFFNGDMSLGDLLDFLRCPCI